LQRGARGNCPRCPPLNPALCVGGITSLQMSTFKYVISRSIPV